MNNDFNLEHCSHSSSFLTMGIFLVLLGSLALTRALTTTMVTVFFFGVLLLAGGLSYMIHGLWTTGWKNFFTQFFVGTLAAISGFLMIANPHIGAASVTLLLGLY
ncbi:DUF308 domain-containing protein, partial [Candidatus Dependentiae bacterium]|nr:DUF308 domain-containing protein [Candidatus Dependentiae bacterium]